MLSKAESASRQAQRCGTRSAQSASSPNPSRSKMPCGQFPRTKVVHLRVHAGLFHQKLKTGTRVGAPLEARRIAPPPSDRYSPIGRNVLASIELARMESVRMARRVLPKREEFEVKENSVIHKPTGAEWSAHAGRP